LLVSANFTSFLSAVNCTHIAIVNPAGQERFGVSRDHFVLSVTVLLLAIALTPLVLAPISEAVRHSFIVAKCADGQFGRNIIFQVTGIM